MRQPGCGTLSLAILMIIRSVTSWAPTVGSSLQHRPQSYRSYAATLTRRYVQVDQEGRRIRRRSYDDDDDVWHADDSRSNNNNIWATTSSSSNDDWDDWDPFQSAPKTQNRERAAPSRNSRRSSGPRERRFDDGPRRNDREFRKDNNFRNNNNNKGRTHKNNEKADNARKINMRALEGAGFVHLYGLAPVLNALRTAKRDFTRPETMINLEDLEGEELEHEMKQRERKPESQFSPWLFVQSQKSSSSTRSGDKQHQAQQVLQLAQERDLPVAYVDKGVLNTLSSNRPHQGYVLRCGKLFFESTMRIPLPNDNDGTPNFWLVLDEVVDPQNLGALIRSAYFMGGERVGLMVCAKNSAPPSPVVSAASAGALELWDVVHSTSNLPRTLANAREDGFRIIGASAVETEYAQVYDLDQLAPCASNEQQPTILVLGSEGHGLRTLVSKACTEFVRIPGGAEGVDSLNVSVTGGILLWHLLRSQS